MLLNASDSAETIIMCNITVTLNYLHWHSRIINGYVILHYSTVQCKLIHDHKLGLIHRCKALYKIQYTSYCATCPCTTSVVLCLYFHQNEWLRRLFYNIWLRYKLFLTWHLCKKGLILSSDETESRFIQESHCTSRVWQVCAMQHVTDLQVMLWLTLHQPNHYKDQSFPSK